MKGSIKSAKSDFKPFEISIVVESAAEARTFYHIFNHTYLGKKMTDGWYNGSFDYKRDVCSLANEHLRGLISEELHKQNESI